MPKARVLSFDGCADTKRRVSDMLVDVYLRIHGLGALVEQTKVRVTRHCDYPNLVSLKYDQIYSPRSDALACQCRGLVLDEADDWRVVAYPYDRFFNYGEGCAASLDWKTVRAYEKMDGSLITLYWYRDCWHVATSGKPDASGELPYDKGRTFRDLFWRVWVECGYQLPRDTGHCYMFELCAPENRVVVNHSERRLVLHGARNLRSFLEVDPVDVALREGWECAEQIPIDDQTEHVAIDCVRTYASLWNGVEHEGAVLCDANFNRIKVKSPSYVALHHLRSDTSSRRLVELVQSGEGPEFLAYFPEYAEDYNRINAAYTAIGAEMDALYASASVEQTQKAFALRVKSKPYASLLFAARHHGVDAPSSLLHTFDSRKVLRMIEGR